MNYYEHHIRDYDAATSHLSWDEDLAYTRLIRWYYRKEQPIPADLKEVCRLVRATSKSQKSAVESVLKEFFILRADGWHQETCDAAIQKFLDGEPEREVKKANENNRLKNHRDERSKLFKALTDAGEHAPWNIGIGELRALVASVTGTLPATKTETPATAPATPATATQTPDASTQTPVIKTIGDRADATEAPRASVQPAELSAAMRRHSVEAQPGDPRIIAAAEQGISVETIEAACEEAKTSDPTGRIKPGFVIAIAQRWTADAAKPRATVGSRQTFRNDRDESRRRAYEVLTGKTAPQSENENLEVINGHVKLLG